MGFAGASAGKESSCNVGETHVQSPGWEDPLEKETATYSSILAWRIPWTVWSMGSQRVEHNWATFTFTLKPHIGGSSPLPDLITFLCSQAHQKSFSKNIRPLILLSISSPKDMVKVVSQRRLTWQSPSIHSRAAVTISCYERWRDRSRLAQVTQHTFAGHENRKVQLLMRQAYIWRAGFSQKP